MEEEELPLMFMDDDLNPVWSFFSQLSVSRSNVGPYALR